jgi:hypothetical protein
VLGRSLGATRRQLLSLKGESVSPFLASKVADGAEAASKLLPIGNKIRG